MHALTQTQRQALLTCDKAGQLLRGRDGYGIERTGGTRYQQRSLYALVRAGLLEHVDGETALRATPAGQRTAEQVRAARLNLRAAA